MAPVQRHVMDDDDDAPELEVVIAAPGSAARPLVVVAECETCHRQATPDRHLVLIVMEPGADGVPGYVCAKCWIDSAVTRPPEEPARRITGALELEPGPDAAPPPKAKARSRSRSPS